MAAGLTTASYSYGFGSHQLDSVTGGAGRTLGYLASGQMSSDVSGGVTEGRHPVCGASSLMVRC